VFKKIKHIEMITTSSSTKNTYISVRNKSGLDKDDSSLSEMEGYLKDSSAKLTPDEFTDNADSRIINPNFTKGKWTQSFIKKGKLRFFDDQQDLLDYSNTKNYIYSDGRRISEEKNIAKYSRGQIRLPPGLSTKLQDFNEYYNFDKKILDRFYSVSFVLDNK